MRTLHFVAPIAAIVSLLAGCSAPEAAPKAASTSSAEQSVTATEGEALYTSCVSMRKREVACSKELLPAVVDLRIRLDKPSGIAAAAKSEGRDTILAAAKREWATDSADPEGFCKEKLSRPTPPAMATVLRDQESCTREATCDGFVACHIPAIEAMMAH